MKYITNMKQTKKIRQNIEYRIMLKSVSSLTRMHLQHFFSDISFDEKYNMFIVVKELFDNNRFILSNIDDNCKLNDNDDMTQLKCDISHMSFPCSPKTFKLLPHEITKIKRIINDPILCELLIDKGNWYNIYYFQEPLNKKSENFERNIPLFYVAIYKIRIFVDDIISCLMPRKNI